MTTQRATCLSCGAVFDESPQTAVKDRKPCPDCGSRDRLFKVELAATVSVRSTLGAKAYEEGRRQPFLEYKGGDSFFRKAAKWVTRIMRIDRRGDRYREHVYDPQSGETIHYCDEPLSEHRGHGSAKKRDV